MKFLKSDRDTVVKLKSGVRTEQLLENYVDKDLQDFLHPLDIAQTATFHRKYNLRNNFITTNGVLSNVLSFISVVIYFAVYLGFILWINVMSIYSEYFGALKIAVSLHYGLMAFLTFVMYITNLLNSDNFVKTIIQIQRIKNTLKFSNIHMRPLICSNWVHLAVVTFCLVVLEARIYYALGLIGGSFVVLNHYNLSFYDATFLYIILLSKLLRSLMQLWVEEFKLSIEKSMKNDDNTAHSWTLNVLFKAYCDSVETFCILKKASAVVIVFYTVMTFYVCLLIEQIFINLEDVKKADGQNGFSIDVTRSTLSYWMIKNVLLIIYLSIQLDQLYETETEIRCECLKTLKTDISVEQKHILKNVIRVSRIHFSKMSPWPMFVVDATLPITFANVVTTYAIVLLQFQM